MFSRANVELERVIAADKAVSAARAERVRAVDAFVTEYRDAALADERPERRRDGYVNDMVERATRLDLASALRMTERAAGAEMGFAYCLVHVYPSVLGALSEGAVTERHATTIVKHFTGVEDHVREALVPEALRMAETMAAGTFDRKLKRLVDSARVDTLQERFDKALQERTVWVTDLDDGMSTLSASIPTVEAHAILNRLTGMARKYKENTDETRTVAQLRADLLCDLLIDGDAVSLQDGARGVRATVAVTVPALALLDGAVSSDGYAELDGVGPIPAAQARILCGGADGWTRILTHPETGVVLSVGRSQYRPPASLRRLVEWRAERCMAPGCARPAKHCDIDHTVAWEHGGETAADNLASLCPGHHTVKHHSHWSVRHTGDDGTLEWTSPTGRVYTVEPRRLNAPARAAGTRAPFFTPDPEPAPF